MTKLETQDYYISSDGSNLTITHKYTGCTVSFRENKTEGDDFSCLVVDYSCNNVTEVNQTARIIYLNDGPIEHDLSGR